jgi:hypothetical protein
VSEGGGRGTGGDWGKEGEMTQTFYAHMNKRNKKKKGKKKKKNPSQKKKSY